MKYVRIWFLFLFTLAPYAPAFAQYQVPQYSVPIGRGGGASGFSSALPGALGQTLMSNGPSAKPSFQPLFRNLVTPEMYGAGAGGDDAAPIRAAMSHLNSIGGGVLHLGSATYNLCSKGANVALINNYSNIDIVGMGASSILRFCNGLNTSSASFVFGIGPTDITAATPVNNVSYRDFVIDMNGENNDCSGTCFAYNFALGIFYGDRIDVRGVTVLNNPGSQAFAFGTNDLIPSVANLTVIGNKIESACDFFNPACTDHSAIWTRSTNATISNNNILNCGGSRGTGIELHGFNVVATGNSIANCFKGVLMAADASNNASVSANNNVIINAFVGIDIWCINTFTYTGAQANGNVVYLDSSIAGAAGIDAATHVGGSGSLELQINDNVITSNIIAPVLVANSFSGIKVSLWSNVSVNGNVVSNIGGPGIYFTGSVIGGVSQWNVIGNTIKDVGQITTATALRSGIVFDAAGTAQLINVQTNSVTNTSTVFATTGIFGQTNAGSGLIAGNITNNVTTPVNWSGAGTAVGTACAGAPSVLFASVNGVVTHC